MSYYAILNNDFNAVTEVRFYETLPAHESGRVLPLVEDAIPEFNPDTHKIISSGFVINQNDVLKTWEVVELDAGELEIVEASKAALTQTNTNLIYNTLSVQYRAMFAPLYVAVKDFLSRKDYEAAYAIIEAQSVPLELEQVKADLLEEIGGNLT